MDPGVLYTKSYEIGVLHRDTLNGTGGLGIPRRLPVHLTPIFHRLQAELTPYFVRRPWGGSGHLRGPLPLVCVFPFRYTAIYVSNDQTGANIA